MGDPIEVRGRRYENDRPPPSPRPPTPVPARKTWGKSEVSFGIWGRLACTAVALVPISMFLLRGTLFWLFIALASLIPAGWWLRDTWTRS